MVVIVLYLGVRYWVGSNVLLRGVLMRDIIDYTWRGDTWYRITEECPECGEGLVSNGRVHKCSGWYRGECQWWDPVGEPMEN